MDYSPPDSSVHGVFQAKILEWVAVPSSRRSSWPTGWIWVSCIAGRFFTVWATRETFSSVQFSCLVMSDSLRPHGLQYPSPVHHQLLELIQTHVHWVGDSIQTSHPLSSPSPVFNLFQHQGLFTWENGTL